MVPAVEKKNKKQFLRDFESIEEDSNRTVCTAKKTDRSKCDLHFAK